MLLGIAGLQAAECAETILFVGNSFTFGAESPPVQRYRPETVTDLNHEGIGGVPALFKCFTREAGLAYDVSLETASGMNLDFHHEQKAALIAGAWDHVVLQGYSTLDADAPGDAGKIIDYSARLAQLFHAANPQVDVRLVATWSRADQTYLASGHWFGKPIEAMALDVRAAYDQAAERSSIIRAVIPVGQAWNRAIAEGIAARNPYQGVAPGQISLWAADGYHASVYGYYLEALVIFGSVTGHDPRSLGRAEEAAAQLGISPTWRSRFSALRSKRSRANESDWNRDQRNASRRITGQQFLEFVVCRFLPESAFGPVRQAPAVVFAGKRRMVFIVELVVENHFHGRIGPENAAIPVVVAPDVSSLRLFAALLVSRGPPGFRDPDRFSAGDDSLHFLEQQVLMEDVVMHGNGVHVFQQTHVDQRFQIGDAI